MIQVMNNSGLYAIQANETQAAQNLVDGKQPREFFLIAQTILQRDHGSIATYERRQQFRKLIVGRRLESDKDYITDANSLRRTSATWTRIEITCRTANENTVSPYHIIVAPEQKVDFMSGATQHRAVIAPDRPATYDGNLHLFFRNGFQNLP
jgi:hypothetical protein